MTKKSPALALSIGLILAACGTARSSSNTRLTVLAAASLKSVFPEIGDGFSRVHPGVTLAFSFAGTDQLAAQIQQGAPADVFAGASTKYGDELVSDHLIGAYAVFCTNRLVLITPASNPADISSLQDLADPGVKLVIGSVTVPVGSYTRTVLANLDAIYGAGYSHNVLANVASNEDSVTSIVAKVESGEADGGFVYVTDARSAGTRVNTISLPDEAEAVARYPISVLVATKSAVLAQQFLDYVLSAPAQALLEQAGFGPQPGP